MKPSVFIGSASESLHVAKIIAAELAKVAECKIWTEQFDIGNSAYEDLCERLSLYDYGILIAAADDVTVSRKTKKASPRDNIIFEFGLFVGRLGRDRALLLVEEGIKLPSDLIGITLPRFKMSSSKTSLTFKRSVVAASDKIKDHLKKRKNVLDYGYLPSTSLAFGYFNNFILKAVSNLIGAKSLKYDGDAYSNKSTAYNAKSKKSNFSLPNEIKFSDVILSILIPDDLSADMFHKVKHVKHLNDWKSVKIDAGAFRPFDFHMQLDRTKGSVLKLSDIPITLNALNDAIQAYVGRSHLGKDEIEELLEQREIRVFKKVLDHLISKNPITKGRVKTELVDI